MAEDFSLTNWLQEAKEDPKKAAPILVIIGVLAFVDWKFLYSPKAVLIEKEMKKNKRLAGEMNSFKSASSQIEDIKLDIEEKKRKLEESQKFCYKEKERTEFLKRVREIANIAEIKVKSINPSPDENRRIGMIEAKKFSVNFSYSGDLLHLVTFMRLIEKEPKVTFMDIPDLIPNRDGTFETKLTVSTLLFPDTLSFEQTENTEDEEDEE